MEVIDFNFENSFLDSFLADEIDFPTNYSLDELICDIHMDQNSDSSHSQAVSPSEPPKIEQQKNEQILPPKKVTSTEINPKIEKKKKKRKREKEADEDVAQKKEKRECIAMACDFCRKRHKKCDGLHPCATCKKANNLCNYSFRLKLPGQDIFE